MLSAQVKVMVGTGLSNADYRISFTFDKSHPTTMLVAEVVSEGCTWGDEPRILFKLMNDSIIDLTGVLFTTTTESSGSVSLYNFSFSSSEHHSIALFPMSDEAIDALSVGIKKMRPNLIPKCKDKEWKTDVLGHKLLQEYCNTPSIDDGF